MKKLIVGGIALLALLLPVWMILTAPPDPVYQQRRLSDWLRDLKPGTSIDRFCTARDTVREMGTNAVPYLLKRLQVRKDTPAKLWVIQQLKKQRWIQVRFLPADEVRETAVLGFFALGLQAEIARAELEKLQSTPELRVEVKRIFNYLESLSKRSLQSERTNPHSQ